MSTYTINQHQGAVYGHNRAQTPGQSSEDTDRWFYTPRPSPFSSIRLYCFPYAGGNATAYRNWVPLLPDEIEMCAIALPGRGMRMAEALRSDLKNISCDIAAAIQIRRPKPFAFWGHSMGAILAYEVACRLQASGVAGPEHLFVSGRQAPHIGSEFRLPVSKMTPDEFRACLFKLNGMPPDINEFPELLELYMPILHNDFSAVDNWSYDRAPALRTAITAVTGNNDPTASFEGVKAWASHTRQEFYMRCFSGDHFYIRQHEQSITKLITATLTGDPWGRN